MKYTVQIAVTSDSRLPRRAEVWLPGYGSWWVANEMIWGLAKREFKFEIEKDTKLVAYPDGRDNDGFTAQFRLTNEMNPKGSPRDMIVVEFNKQSVSIRGLPVKACKANKGKSYLEFPRNPYSLLVIPKGKSSVN